jgi:hypothetical protein
VTRDSIGYEGEDENLFRYCFNDSLNLIDTDGNNPFVAQSIRWGIQIAQMVAQRVAQKAAAQMAAREAARQAAAAATKATTSTKDIGCPERCTQEQKDKLHDIVNRECKNLKSSCKDQTLSSAECLARSVVAFRCAQARLTMQRTCWRSTDPGWDTHMDKIREAEKVSQDCAMQAIIRESRGK